MADSKDGRVSAVERFAAEAVAFREWAARGTDTGAVSARNALRCITRLYLAALELPPPRSEELAGQPDANRIEDAEWGVVFTAARRLPLDEYGTVFDPLAVSSGEPVVGSLADDIADIYRDVVTGLRAFEAGRMASAVWEWGFGFQHHWGRHASEAIRALHAWLADHAPDHLVTVPEPGALRS
jgi:hypothetical protein